MPKLKKKTGKWEDLGFLLYLAQNPILRGFADNWEKKSREELGLF